MEFDMPPPPVMPLENGQNVTEANTPPYQGEEKTLGCKFATQPSPDPPSPPYQRHDKIIAEGSAVPTVPVPPSPSHSEPEPLALPSASYEDASNVKSPFQWQTISEDVNTMYGLRLPLN